MKKIILYLLGIYYSVIFKIVSLYNENKLKEFKYRALIYISYYNKDLFKKYKQKIEAMNLSTLGSKEKIKIGFFTYTPTMWSIDRLYKLLGNTEGYEVELIITKFKTLSEDTMEKNFQDTKEYFSKNNYKYITPFDLGFNINNYDILFYLTPYNLLPNSINVKNIESKILICYVSYSFMLADKNEKLDLPMYFLSWRFYCDSLFYKDLITNESRVFSNNAVYYGYPKMDEFYLYSINKKNHDKKVIIYAPHHSLLRDRMNFSTFNQNYKFILSLAKKYSKETYWVYKPHPLLRSHSVISGLFNSETEYDLYLKEWKDLDNARVTDNESYIETFVNSDAMITDSVSFIAEYQYSQKPLLLLENSNTHYNEFGENIKKIVYKCYGNEFDKIENFICQVLSGNDEKKEARKNFFDQNLNYKKTNKLLANDKMYKELIQTIRKGIK